MLRGLHVARRCVATTTAHRCLATTAQHHQRVAKLVARTGAMSRREADAALDAGRITVNNVVASLGDKAPPDARLKLDGRALKAAPTAPRVWLAYKHKGEQVAKAERGEKIPSVFSRAVSYTHLTLPTKRIV